MILDLNDAKTLVSILQKSGKQVVFTNGCFDILHRGHVDYLEKARKLGDFLIIGVNSDSSVKKLKGESRPINNENDRAFVLDALKCVDAAVIFSENTAERLVSELKPDIYAKGGDYTIDTLPEGQIVLKNGGKVEIIPFVDGYSTTKTIERMK
ncbi:MAG: D-glycero-beta-D-manno-heptose 1-phosphate adenylyltransferase [Selenomonadaceae bacterium]|nr:D-glycero-beta-D-manno-heptose 1-phosphate adenylyltransferase [Selenomonadaceae bacterium]